MAEFMFDPHNGVEVINDTDVDTGEVFRALEAADPEVAAMVRWSNATRLPTSRRASLVERDAYVDPQNVFEQMKLAYYAAESDDVVSGVVESTEALAFAKMSIDCDDEDEADIWNQIAEDLDLDSRLREMWREDFIVSQFYCAVWWGRRSYKVRGKNDDTNRPRKKSYANLDVPIGITILDPLKVVPVGNLLFNKERLAYQADNTEEYDLILATIEGRHTDPVIEQLMVGPYYPDEVEERLLSQDGIQTGRLFELNGENVWRHTDTRSQYSRWAPVRMKSIFEVLDLKHQLRAMDRAHLLGGTNFIVLIKKGDKERPAKPGEISALQQNVRSLSRVPVIVGDDRLSIEIITPKTDTTLAPERYNGLDARITARLYQMFMTGNFAAGAKGDDSVKLAKVVARGLESRRHMLRRSVEKHVLKQAYRRNDQFDEQPKLRFHPKRIALDFDPTFATYLLDLLDRGVLSWESVLEEIDYDLANEVRRRKAEEKYKTVLQPRVLPSQATDAAVPLKPAPKPVAPASVAPGGKADPKGAGRSAGRTQGGVKKGGGAAPGTGQGQPARNPAKKSDNK